MSNHTHGFRQRLLLYRSAQRVLTGVLLCGSTLNAAATPRVTRLPTSRIVELRGRLQAELKGDSDRQPIDRLIHLGLGRARTGLIAVEEASTFLDDHRAGIDGRVRRVMGIAERILDETTLNDGERVTLRGYLDLHLKLFKSFRPLATIQMMYRHHLWDADHLPFILSQMDNALSRQLMYRALIDLRGKLGPEQMAALIHRLRVNPRNSIEQLAMLDEFAPLDQPKYENLIKRLQLNFCNEDGHGRSHRILSQEILLRAVDRIQDRLLRRDPATIWAVRKVAGTPGSDSGAAFFQRLEAGDFDIEMSVDTFASPDPLGLRPAPASNVVPLRCVRRLDSSR